VQDEGRRLGLSGWVRNLPGGEVELEASGKSEALSELVETVQRGPTLARVLDVQTEWGEGDLQKGEDSWGYYRF
jgi:acylphosphatase